MIYITSDIHGQKDRFHDLLNKINLQSEDKLYILGNVIDGNPGGIHILLEIMNMDNVFLVPGNHEYMMMNAIARTSSGSNLFYMNNYDTTVWAYNGGNVSSSEFSALSSEEKDEILDYFKGLKYEYDETVNGKHYKLVHSATLDCYREWLRNSSSNTMKLCAYQNSKEYCVWYKMKPEDLHHDYVVVHGHTPAEEYKEAELRRTAAHISELFNTQPTDHPIKQSQFEDDDDEFDDGDYHPELEEIDEDLNDILPKGTVAPKIYISEKEIAVNCGCLITQDPETREQHYDPKVLGCLCLDTMEEFYSDI